MYKTKWLIGLCIVLLVSVFSTGAVHGADFDFRISTTYTINQNSQVTARTIIDVTNNVTQPPPSSIVLPVSGEASDITAAYQDGGNITSNYTPDSQTIRLETNRAPSGKSRKWSIVINYKVDALQQLGKTTIMSVAPQTYEGLNVKQETISIAADLRLGVAIRRGPKPATSRIVAGQQVLTWQNKQGAVTDAVGVLFGDNAVADVRISKQLKNDSWWWQDVIFTLPPDTNQQQVYLQELSPQPSNVTIDVDGNILATYRLRPQQSIEASARLSIVVNNFTYAIDAQLPLSETPTQVVERYTSNVGPWTDSDTEYELSSETSADIIRTIYQAVAAVGVEGDSIFDRGRELSDRLIGELRAAGVPARLVLGHSFGDGGRLFDEAQPHAWVEAYAAGVGWMTLDPLFEQSGDYFGTTDVQHIGLVLRGIEPDFPPSQLADTTVTFTENDVPEAPEMIPELSATNYMILPGLAVQSVSASLPSGVIVDGNGIAVANQPPKAVGSLAPLQRVTLRNVLIGPSAFAADTVSYGYLLDGSIQEALAQTTVSVNYAPMLILIGMALLIFGGRFIYRRRSGKPKKQKRTKDAVTFASEDAGDSIERSDLLPRAQPSIPPLPQQNQSAGSNRPQTAAPGNDTMSGNDQPPQHERPHRQRIQ